MAPTTALKYAGWLTKAEAAAALEVNEKTIERLADRRELRQASRPVPGRRPSAVFHPADVAHLVEQKQAKQREQEALAVTPNPDTAATPRKAADTAWLATMESLRQAFVALAPAVESLKLPAPPLVPIAQKLMLTLEEAATYSGVPKGFLLERIHAGRLKAVKHGRWYIPRAALEDIQTWL